MLQENESISKEFRDTTLVYWPDWLGSIRCWRATTSFHFPANPAATPLPRVLFSLLLVHFFFLFLYGKFLFTTTRSCPSLGRLPHYFHCYSFFKANFSFGPSPATTVTTPPPFLCFLSFLEVFLYFLFEEVGDLNVTALCTRPWLCLRIALTMQYGLKYCATMV